ncbi:MAG: porin [Hyphomicrobiales bacterium]|nr:MAG: porin [Hyphomicrobiales bacterium]
MPARRRGAGRVARSRRALAAGLWPLSAVLAVAVVGPQGAAAQEAGKASSDKTPANAWSGSYLGGGLGISWGQGNWRTEGPAGETASGRFNFFNEFDAFKGTGSYSVAIQGGRDWRLPSGVVLGVVADAQASSLVQGRETQTTANVGQARIAEDVALLGTVRGRLGVVRDNWLWYGTAGWAWSWNHYTRDQLSGTPTGGTATPGTSELVNVFRSGYAVGGGVEMPVARNWTADFQYLYTSFGTTSAHFAQGAQTISSNLDLQTVRLGLNYRFDADAKGEEQRLPQPPKSLDWSVHGQTTYVQQYVPGFRSPYVGTNSLTPNQTRQTWDATFYLGFRPWQDAEVWINPEIDQGFGVSGTLGLAGFSSGEAYKLGSEHPYARIHRSFIRQTFNISGESEKVEAGPNQLAGTQRENRVVVTVGKFGVPDIFDTNKYAHDPRADFLNWSLIDTGSFDYAADAWGYTYGAAVEFYSKRWALRLGLFDLPTVPNSTQLDPTFGQFQWVGEIERRYEVNGNPGKVALTAFLTRARMGRFSDAIALANATSQPADITAVRAYRSRGGISFNMEQQITPTIGFFARAGWADGSSEPFAFTDIDRTAAAGLVFNGKAWGRPDDTLGVAGVVNGISRVHQEFLNAGGLGILVGDGRLPSPAGERILETYYSFPVGSFRATLDYQYVENPAYNTERGPVSIIGTRIRKAF